MDRATARKFALKFHQRYGGEGPRFTTCSLADMTEVCEEAWYRKTKCKMLTLFLHAEGCPRSDRFCSEVLCSKPVAEFLNEHCKLFGWEFTDKSSKKRVRYAVGRLLHFKDATTLNSLSPEKLPVLVVLTRELCGWEVIAMLRGDKVTQKDVLECLQMTKEVSEAQDLINQQREEEDTPGTKPWRDRNSTARKDWSRSYVAAHDESSTWSIPLSLEYEVELINLQRDAERAEDEQRARERKWKKEVTEAVVSGDTAALDRLVTSGEGDLTVCVDAPNILHETCSLLNHAAWEGHVHLLPLLLQAGLSVEGHGTSSFTPLMAGVLHGHSDVVEVLLRHGASGHATNEQGRTALHLACGVGHLRCVDLLIPVTPKDTKDNTGRTPVHVASLMGHLEVVVRLQQAGWKLDVQDGGGGSPLHGAASSGNRQLVQHLVAAGLSPQLKNEDNMTPLDVAVKRGNHEVENWFMKHRRRRGNGPHTVERTLNLIREQKETEELIFRVYLDALQNHEMDRLKEHVARNDPHLVNEKGWTILHMMIYIGFRKHFITQLLETGIHPHTRSHKGETPLDLMIKKLTPPDSQSVRKEDEEHLTILDSHTCPQMEGSPAELYEKLLAVISKGDDWREVSRLLCAGVPMELAGDLPSSALQLAVTNDRPRIVRLLLACGASLTHSSQGLNLLQQAWYSPNTTARVHCALLAAFSGQLKRERNQLKHHGKGMRADLCQLIQAVDGEEPWAACWPAGRSVAKMTDFMVSAASANCPLMASFLQWAGAWPYVAVGGTTALHEAIRAGHLTLVEVMVRDLGASLYTPDARGCLPSNMDQLDPGFLARLEEMMYQQERGRLEALVLQQKDRSEQTKAEAVLALQDKLFRWHKEGHMVMTGEVDEAVGVQALLVACHKGLLQMLHLLLAVGRLPLDTVLDGVCGTTALHEAAAHGKSGCVAHLLHALKAAAATNASNVAAITAAAATTSVRGRRLDRYSPLQPDRYGQTALHLAAMFGHSHTLELLQLSVDWDPTCRAGTTAREVQDNFVGYLKRYRRFCDPPQVVASPLAQWEPQETLKRLLQGVDLSRLPSNAWRARVDFSDEGEAAQVRRAVMRAVGVVLGGAGYMSGRRVRLELVGSARDGSKLFAPDEFDVNVVVSAGECVRVTVQQADRTQGHPCVLGVQTEEPALQGPQLAEGLQQAVSRALTRAVMDEPRLSVVPPGLSPTQVGVALNLAWQGEQYPLLLVGVDLVPVLEVWWHPDIERPALTPRNTATMHLSATRDGSWRCSFALLEARVLGSMTPEQRLVQLCAKLLLASLKAERWMPRSVKALCMWWSGRPWTVPVPGGFCLKSCLFLQLERPGWGQDGALLGLMEVFEEMCLDRETNTWEPQQIKAYFGGDFEKAKGSPNALLILDHLRRATTRRQRCLLALSTLRRWWWQWGCCQRLNGVRGLWCVVQRLQAATQTTTIWLILHFLLTECWQRL